MKFEFENRIYSYIASFASFLLLALNIIFSGYVNLNEIAKIFLILVAFNLSFSYLRYFSKIKHVINEVGVYVDFLRFLVSYIIGAYIFYLSGGYNNSSVLMFLSVMVLTSVHYFGKRVGVICLLLTMLNALVFSMRPDPDIYLWKTMMLILSTTAGYIVGTHLNMLSKSRRALSRKAKEMEILFKLSKLIDRFPGVESILSETTRLIVESFGIDESYIMIYDEEREELVKKSYYSNRSFKSEGEVPSAFKPGKGIPGKVFLSGEAIYCCSGAYKEYGCLVENKRRFEAFGVVPVKIHDKTIGVISIASTNIMECDEDSKVLIDTVASRLGEVINTQRLYRELEKSARKDSLTGLYNHGYFYERLDYEINLSKGIDTSLYVIMLDIDKFKSVNDKYGHIVGDKVLRKIGDMISSELSSKDVSARYGGEEFGIIMKRKNRGEVCEFAKVIRKKVEELYSEIDELKKDNAQITISIGISKYPSDGISSEELVEVADRRMYRAKSDGGDRLCSGELVS